MYSRRCLKTLYLLLLIVQNSYAQNTSAFENLLVSANNNINSGGYNQATLQLTDALKQSEITKNRKNEAHVYDLLAEISIKKREFAAFKTFDDLTNPIANQLKDTALLVSLSNRRGIYYMEEGKNDLATNHYYKSSLNFNKYR
ncbi:MAG: hypothetical protein EOP00_24980 [Pedobacter sp.]|nr:MAG: hypothetical protein EOP00_24980 [Pedobacter sp.]